MEALWLRLAALGWVFFRAAVFRGPDQGVGRPEDRLLGFLIGFAQMILFFFLRKLEVVSRGPPLSASSLLPPPHPPPQASLTFLLPPSFLSCSHLGLLPSVLLQPSLVCCWGCWRSSNLLSQTERTAWPSSRCWRTVLNGGRKRCVCPEKVAECLGNWQDVVIVHFQSGIIQIRGVLE